MSKIKNLKALWILVAIFGLSVTIAQAQTTTGNVGINTDNPKATLDVKKGVENGHVAGIIAPYVTGQNLTDATNYGPEQNAAIVYVTDPAGAQVGLDEQTEFVTAEGYYYFDADAEDSKGRWMRLTIGNPVEDKKVNWFYMPSISISTKLPEGIDDYPFEAEINLYNEYKDQFTTPDVASTGAPAAIPNFPEATDLYYYITDYDGNVLDISSSGLGLSAEGVLSYKVLSAPTPCSFINIVFVIK